MKIVSNELEGKYACPKDHPVTCLNPAPWKITEMKIVYDYDSASGMMWKVLIRGEGVRVGFEQIKVS